MLASPQTARPLSWLKIPIFLSIAWICSACTSFLTQFVGDPAQDFQGTLCPLEEYCGIQLTEGYILYTVSPMPGSNRYQVTGELDLEWDAWESDQWIEFYLLFLDAQKVVHEKKVKTLSSKSGFDFGVEIDTPVEASAVTKIFLWTRS